ncbi:MAG: ABC transporter substrate-binding protein [Methanothrix sp.]|nr:ABC transporter substrate-binding protein [Methanothrix sp.]MDD4446469.1 ABC transporter substrate-binding protein [Methanothrix sp.]
MNNRIVSALLILPLMALLLCGSCGAAEYPMTITDSADREVTLQMPVERIIVLSTDAAEAVELLGAGDMIVGVTDTVQKYSWYFPNLKNKALVGKWSAPDYEVIAQIAKGNEDAITPNILVLGYPSGKTGGKSYGVDAVEEGLAPFKDIAVAGFSFYKGDSIDKEITLLGQILGKEDKAAEYVAWKNSKKEAIANAVEGKGISKVYFENTQPKGLGELKTNGGKSDIDKSIRLAGGLNIFGSSDDEAITTSWETVISKNPDVILQAKSDDVLGWGAFPSSNTIAAQQVREEIMSRTGGKAVPAIKNDKVWIVYRKILYGPGSVAGTAFMAKLLHPDADLDPAGVYIEYLDLLGIKYPEGRTFVFPELESE